MFDDLTWEAILQAWPWFGAAAVVFVGAVGLFIALRPKPKRQTEAAADAADRMGWTLTGRIDLADPRSVGALVLEVEETRISVSPSGVEHREIRWRRATPGFPLVDLFDGAAVRRGSARSRHRR